MARTEDPVRLLEERQAAVRAAERRTTEAYDALADACARANRAGLSFASIGSVLDVSKQYAAKLAARSPLYVSTRSDDDQPVAS